MSQHRPSAVIVLAAGEGTRMKSATPKVLHGIGGRSLLGHAMAAARGLQPDHLCVVVRHCREQVASHVVQTDPLAVVADQDEVKGTGRAVWCGLRPLPDPLRGTVVVTYGDVPLLTTRTLEDLVRTHETDANAVTVLTAHVADPTGYGRVVRDLDGSVARIVEHKDADEIQRAITEINSGIYAFDAAVLREALGRLDPDNAQGELYLTDVLALAKADGRPVKAMGTDDLWQVEGVNDRVQLAAMGRELNTRILREWMRSGVTVVDPGTTWVDVEVEIERDVILLPGTQLCGCTRIGARSTIGPDTTLTNCVVEANARIIRCHGVEAKIGAGAEVGPFVHLAAGADLQPGDAIGPFRRAPGVAVWGGGAATADDDHRAGPASRA
ncbi:MAG: bifunctional UDP-N-acetylglucosamine pyrophosphorylase / glucosamine-phosphate N-acetyltransferase [Actinomycetota bacterium]|nr:bifunctional UDP-N-acetylglucosamine pyrophosphorylase / glucosamine-phosphate N-acetyltransferase [Actinomycetota bacterium]